MKSAQPLSLAFIIFISLIVEVSMAVDRNKSGERLRSSLVAGLNSITKVELPAGSSSAHPTDSAMLLDQISEANYPHIFQFFSGYFNEDWRDDVISVVEDWERTAEPEEYIFRRVVAKYIYQSLPIDIINATAELEKLLELPLNNDQLQTVVSRNFGCYFVPADSIGYRQWLNAIRNQLCIVRPHHIRKPR
jgi:CdiI immunity protein